MSELFDINKSDLSIDDIVKQMQKLNISKRYPIYADGARPEAIEQIKRAGYNIKQATKNVLDGINTVKEYDLKVLEGHTNIIRELETFDTHPLSHPRA